MRFQRFFFLLFIFMMSLLLIHGQRPANLAMRRKFHRHSCLQRRCMPLHSRVPFP
ncbi:apelin receptor early endogenous ligand [Hippopotamus amphibius kiboko]|uniref:apelin receptor early endogenous ligand n=1 Tax=Hippopotamus amphibius kiboko TaxID=575201 RepID=UPI00259807E8|nr:apelin receptor early endogenous ligand [Hippopotamus amphibius kiboko]XP_057585097.1 apelin receptor early endogenous ligand [Hippopotamus amphibius kiboko]XP_057585098.1 apelin receptor early endogenous ligand [Hippopotamus amphibius kiboko]